MEPSKGEFNLLPFRTVAVAWKGLENVHYSRFPGLTDASISHFCIDSKRKLFDCGVWGMVWKFGSTHRFGDSRDPLLFAKYLKGRISMGRKWSTKDRNQVISGLVVAGVLILFALFFATPIQRWMALGFALLFGAGSIGYTLPLLGFLPERELARRISPPPAMPAVKLSGPVITSVKGLGEMRRYPDIPDWLCSEPVKVEVFEGKLVPFIIEEVDLVSSRELIESAVANFLGLNAGQREGITALAYKNYQASDPPPPEVKDPSEIWRYIYPSEVFVKQGPEDKNFYIVVSGDCEWEIEHGLEMVFKYGDQIVSVGQAGDW